MAGDGGGYSNHVPAVIGCHSGHVIRCFRTKVWIEGMDSDMMRQNGQSHMPWKAYWAALRAMGGRVGKGKCLGWQNWQSQVP